MFNKIKNKKGVTLVELLAVVVIMGIVAAIAVPTIGGLIATQQANADNATFGQIEEAARLYAVNDPDGVFTLADMSSYIDLRANVIKYSLDGTATATTATTLTEANYSLLSIEVDGSDVSFAFATGPDTTIDLYINNTLVWDFGAPGL